MSFVRVAIVDAYSSGSMLAEALQVRGASCVAVESSPTLPRSLKQRFNPAAFDAVITHRGDLQATTDALISQQVTQVLPGGESGVELAEALAHRLALPVNDPRLAAARRDKFLMNEVVGAQGLRTARQFQSSRIDDLLAWVRTDLDWPVIVKPTKSMASDHVFCCRSSPELREAAAAILATPNAMGNRNETVLVQEYLPGVEYVVDIVAYDGHKKTTAFWEYLPGRSHPDWSGYSGMALLPYQGLRQSQLEAYAFAVLDALAIRNGPAHCEMKWVDGQPVLIEVGARLTAGNNAILSRLCGGTCQLDETVEIILAPERFLAKLGEQPRLRQRATVVFLAPPRKGRLRQLHGIETLHQLPTLHALSLRPQPGDELDRVAGWIALIHEDPYAIERDLDTIRKLERNGIFEMVDDPLVPSPGPQE